MTGRSPRQRVWIVLSDLFLDTDVAGTLGYIERELRAAPFSVDAVEAILRDEVAPVLLPNLYSPAGVWDGFDADWLIAEIEARRARPRRFLALRRWLRARALRRMVPEWAVLRARLEA